MVGIGMAASICGHGCPYGRCFCSSRQIPLICSSCHSLRAPAPVGAVIRRLQHFVMLLGNAIDRWLYGRPSGGTVRSTPASSPALSPRRGSFLSNGGSFLSLTVSPALNSRHCSFLRSVVASTSLPLTQSTSDVFLQLNFVPLYVLFCNQLLTSLD